MLRMGQAVAGIMLFFVAAGCATTRPASVPSLENRLSVLETKVQVLEGEGSFETARISYDVRETSAPLVEASGLTNKQIQQALKNAGYYSGPIDGKVGPKTKAAIREFQSDMRLKVDGVAGKNTREKLLKYLP